tara:strand:- start:821 stop:1012 length:192 start_codon:yes stop_codon:yes gene_type:complete
MNQSVKITEGQKITFKHEGAIYTKKVKEVVTRKFNDVISYNVNPIGSGTQYVSVDHEDVITVK